MSTLSNILILLCLLAGVGCAVSKTEQKQNVNISTSKVLEVNSITLQKVIPGQQSAKDYYSLSFQLSDSSLKPHSFVYRDYKNDFAKANKHDNNYTLNLIKFSPEVRSPYLNVTYKDKNEIKSKVIESFNLLPDLYMP